MGKDHTYSECSWITKLDRVRIAKKENSRITKDKKKTGGGSPPKPPTCAITANVMEMFGGTVQFDGLIGSETSVGRKSG